MQAVMRRKQNSNSAAEAETSTLATETAKQSNQIFDEAACFKCLGDAVDCAVKRYNKKKAKRQCRSKCKNSPGSSLNSVLRSFIRSECKLPKTQRLNRRTRIAMFRSRKLKNLIVEMNIHLRNTMKKSISEQIDELKGISKSLKKFIAR